MDFRLYYKNTRVSHGRFRPEIIQAHTPSEAFKIGVKIMRHDNIDVDNFSTFYVTPMKCDLNTGYHRQIHGWDNVGSLPRKHYRI